MLHILTKVKIVIISIIDSNESEIILIYFINKKITKADNKLHTFQPAVSCPYSNSIFWFKI
jgi:hypothetical protein